MNLLKWLQSKTRSKVIHSDFITTSTQEDPRTLESIKQARKSFDEQQQQMQMRALKAHSADCKDPWTCTKSPCFVRMPDKIVGEPIIVPSKRAVRLKRGRENLLGDLNNKLDI